MVVEGFSKLMLRAEEGGPIIGFEVENGDPTTSLLQFTDDTLFSSHWRGTLQVCLLFGGRITLIIASLVYVSMHFMSLY